MINNRRLSESLEKRYLREDDEQQEYRKVEVTEDDTQYLTRLYNTSGLTILGLVDNDNNLKEFLEYVKKYSTPKENIPLYVVSGKVMNNVYGLTGEKAYPEDLRIVAISLGDLDDIEPELYRDRMNIKDSGWFDDIVKNNELVINYGETSENNDIMNESFNRKYFRKK